MEQRPTLIMMKGLPFSGKTEWATKWASEDPTRRIRLSWSDFLRSTGRANRYRHVVAFEGICHMMLTALRLGMDVCIDEENLDGVMWGVFVARAQQEHARVIWQTIRATPVECKQRAVKYYVGGENCRRVCQDIDRKAELFGPWLEK